MEVEWEMKKEGRGAAAIVIKLFGSNGAATMREGERERDLPLTNLSNGKWPRTKDTRH